MSVEVTSEYYGCERMTTKYEVKEEKEEDDIDTDIDAKG